MRGFAAVAQLDRVLGYEPRGRGFNSCQPHQNFGSRNTARKRKFPSCFSLWRSFLGGSATRRKDRSPTRNAIRSTHAIVQGFAAVAQLDRVLGYEPRGRGFNSCQPHQNFGSRNTARKRQFPGCFSLCARWRSPRVVAREMTARRACASRRAALPGCATRPETVRTCESPAQARVARRCCHGFCSGSDRTAPCPPRRVPAPPRRSVRPRPSRRPCRRRRDRASAGAPR